MKRSDPISSLLKCQCYSGAVRLVADHRISYQSFQSAEIALVIYLLGVLVDNCGGTLIRCGHGFMLSESWVLASRHAELEYDPSEFDGAVVLVAIF